VGSSRIEDREVEAAEPLRVGDQLDRDDLEEVWLPSLGQIDFYDQPPLIDAAADAIVDFFDRRLARR
jgi:hypothetical protein